MGKKEKPKAVLAWRDDVKDPTPPPYSDDDELPSYTDGVKA
jgi:hypothetical protein